MRKGNLIIIGATAIGGAFSIFLRWLQNSIIFDAETGLARRGASISWALIVLCIAVAAVELFLTLRSRAVLTDVPKNSPFLADHKLIQIFYSAMSALTALGGVLLLLHTLLGGRSVDTVLKLILSVLAIGTGAALFILASGKTKDSSANCLCSAVPIVFYCFWLIVCYKDNASDPVIWGFCMQLLAIAAAALAWYYVAGYAFERPQPARAMFFSQLAAFLGILVMADSRSIGEQLLLLCPGLMLLLFASQRIPHSKNSETEGE